jgi:DNA-binding NarL/FixJ family response regulator
MYQRPPSGPIRVVLADDHQLMREGLKRLLERTSGIHVVAESADGFELLRLLRERPADVVVTDLSMPGMPGIDLIKRLKSEFPHLAVLVLTMHAEDQYALRAFRSGANGYLTKDSAGTELEQAIRKVAAGGAFVTPQMGERLALGLRLFSEQPAHDHLSDREFEVFRHIVSGKRLTDIADELHLSIKTVSTHKCRLLEKLGVTSTAALVRYGMQHRLFAEV